MRGDRLKALREERSFSREKLADLLEIGRAQVYRYETGENDPTGEVLVRMSRLFNVSTDYLLGTSDQPGLYLSTSNLTDSEMKAITAWRRGDRYGAVKVIVTDD